MKIDIEKRYRIETGEPNAINIILVGCGGTGSFAALHLARLAYTIKEQGRAINLVFVDPDTVELKNVARQNFCPAEVGRPKAQTLAQRFGLAFGLNIESVVGRFEDGMIRRHRGNDAMTLVVGAVDSPQARLTIAQAMERAPAYVPRARLWWLDAGNNEYSGQVLLGNSPKPQPVISPLGMCAELPLPHLQESGIVADANASAGQTSETLSCAELAALNVQSIMINHAMADWLAVYAYRLLLAHDLDIMATFVDQRSGSVRSVPIVGKMAQIDVLAQARGVAEQALRAAGLADYGDELDELEDDWITCPGCGGDIIEGEDEIDGVVTEIVFCAEADCDWRMTRREFDEMRLGLIEDQYE